ncbi:unnamed protein product, partial [Diamesa hyperborea]
QSSAINSPSASSMSQMYIDPRHPSLQQQQLHARRIFQEWTLQFGPTGVGPSAPGARYLN